MGKFICIFVGEERKVRTRMAFPIVSERQELALLSYRTMGKFSNNNNTRKSIELSRVFLLVIIILLDSLDDSVY